MTGPDPQQQKEVIVATEKTQVSFRMIVAGISVGLVAGLGVYGWQENVILAIVAAIVGFVFGYLSGTFIY